MGLFRGLFGLLLDLHVQRDADRSIGIFAIQARGDTGL